MSDSSAILHKASVDALLGGLRALRHLLDKAQECVATGTFTEAQLLETRLADDMHPFRQQIQHASDAAKACAMRLAGRSVPSLEDTESSLQELRARVDKTEEILRQVSPADLADAQARTIKVNLRRRWVTFDGASYLVEFALPNFFFHVTTAYAILRHLGAKVGKLDYLIDAAQRRLDVNGGSPPEQQPREP